MVNCSGKYIHFFLISAALTLAPDKDVIEGMIILFEEIIFLKIYLYYYIDTQ